MSRQIDALIAEHVMGNDLRPYSTVIQAAWEVVEKFDQFCFYKGSQGYYLNIGDDFINIRDFGDFEIYSEKKAPMSICLAALKAKGIKVEQGE